MLKNSLIAIFTILAFIGFADAKTKGFATGKAFRMSLTVSDCLFLI
jgi:hypothetical protein